MRFVITLFTAAAAMLVAVAGNEVVEQQQAIARAVPTRGVVRAAPPARVRTTESVDTKNRRSVQYIPEVPYRYERDGVVLHGTRVFPRYAGTSRAQAEQIVADHPPGKEVAVWYDPADPTNPAKAFLVREWTVAPYIGLLFATLFLCVGLAFWAAKPWQRTRVTPPVPVANGNGHEIPIAVPAHLRRRPWRVVSGAWIIVGTAAAWHYFSYATPTYQPGAVAMFAAYFAVGLIPLVIYIRMVRASKRAGDARLIANADAYRIGRAFDVRVEQIQHQPARIESVRVGLIADRVARRVVKGKNVNQRGPLYENWVDAKVTDADVGPGKPLAAKAKVSVPADQPPTTPAESAEWPRVRWRVVVEVNTAGSPPYRAEYPIVVASA